MADAIKGKSDDFFNRVLSVIGKTTEEQVAELLKKSKQKGRNAMYDITIIGAGFSGVYAALELAKDGHKILILESDSLCFLLHKHYSFPDPQLLVDS